MRKIGKNIILGVFYLLNIFSISIFAQDINFEIQVNKTEIAEGESLKIHFTSNEKIENFNPPDFGSFFLLSGPNHSSQFTYVNGVSTKKESIGYILQPTKKGKFTINSATADIAGNQYTTKPVTINVISIKTRSNQTHSIAKSNDSPVKLQIIVSKSNPYINEPIVMTYRLLFDRQISNPTVVKEPQLDGFWIKELRTEASTYHVYKVKIKGKSYNAIDYHSFTLIPQKSGKIYIPSYVLNIPVEYATNKRDWWGMSVTETKNVVAKARPKPINVKPLPSVPKGKIFSKAVGRLKSKLKVDRTKLKTGEAITITFEVSGSGNLEMLNFKPYNPGKQFEVYEPQIKSNIKYTTKGASGKTTFSQVIVPNYANKYNLPPMELTYFDLRRKKYVTLKGNIPTIIVEEGKKYDKILTNGNGSSDDINQQKLNKINEDIRFISTENNLEKKGNKFKFENTALHYSLLSLPIFIILLALLLELLQRTIFASQSVQNSRLKSDTLKILNNLKKEISTLKKEEFWNQYHQILLHYLKKKFKLSISEINEDEVRNWYLRGEISQLTSDSIIEIINDINKQRFSPDFGSSSKELAVEKLFKLIENA